MKEYLFFQLDVACQIYLRGKEREIERQRVEDQQVSREEEISDNSNNVAQTVGHNMYILAYQVNQHHLSSLLFHRYFSYLDIIENWKY